MSYTRHIILASILFFQISLSNDVAPQNHQSIGIRPSSSGISNEDHDAIEKELLDQRTKSVKESTNITLNDIEEMESVFASSPQQAQYIVDYLKDPSCFPGVEGYRSAFFVGEPGTGKSVMAKAIGYKMTQEGWEYKFIPSTSFLGNHRNQTSIRLKQELETIETSNKPTLIIIDELNRLLEHSNSKHHDTDTTSTALWTFIDRQKNNNNIFIIGTMNRINKLPKPFKDRMFSGYITFPLINDANFKNKLFRRNLTTANTQLDKDVTDEVLNKELEKISSCSARSLKQITLGILIGQKTSKEEMPLIIKKEAISNAIEQYLFQKAEMDYDIEEETDEERQERHHKENLDMNERHFVQQQMISINTSFYLTSTSTSYKNKVLDLISDEQKEIFDSMLTKTHERKAAEEAAAKKNSFINTLLRKK